MTTFDPRMTAYFGGEVLSAGFLPVPHLLLRCYGQLGLTPAQVVFVLHLMQCTWECHAPPRTVGDLARRMAVAPRTVRRYCEELTERGLLRMQPCYDTRGRQVENRYDLEPLFAQLAQMGVHTSGLRQEHTADAAEHAATSTGRIVPSTALAAARQGARIADVAASDRPIHAARIGRSGLNQRISNKKKIKKEKQNKEGLLLAEIVDEQGFSLRRGTRLNAVQLAQSRRLLERAGVEPPVRDWVAPSLDPAEVWSLRAYALALGWRPALLITQIYDKHTRSAQPASVLRSEHDCVGNALAVLDMDAAERLLQLVGQHCPGAYAAVFDAPPVRGGSPALRTAADALWAMVAALRGAPMVAPAPPSEASDDALWIEVAARLRPLLTPEEWTTWFSAVRLEVEGSLAVLVVPHIFARDYITATHLPALAAALTAATGRTWDLRIAIGP